MFMLLIAVALLYVTINMLVKQLNNKIEQVNPSNTIHKTYVPDRPKESHYEVTIDKEELEILGF